MDIAKIPERLAIVVMILMCIARFIPTSLNFAIDAQCIYIGDPNEKCNGSLFGEHHQKIYNDIGAFSSLMEFISSFLCTVAVFLWKPFNKKNFFISIFFVGHFYSWGALLAFFIISNISLQIVHAGSDNSWLLLISTIGEAVFTITLACAINFVDREFLRQRLESKIMFNLYDVTLFLFAYRNLTLFLYDTGLVALSVSLISQGRSSNKDFTSFVLVMNVALRGSMAQFYFAKLFQGRRLKKVCKGPYESIPRTPESNPDRSQRRTICVNCESNSDRREVSRRLYRQSTFKRRRLILLSKRCNNTVQKCLCYHFIQSLKTSKLNSKSDLHVDT